MDNFEDSFLEQAKSWDEERLGGRKAFPWPENYDFGEEEEEGGYPFGQFDFDSFDQEPVREPQQQQFTERHEKRYDPLLRSVDTPITPITTTSTTQNTTEQTLSRGQIARKEMQGALKSLRIGAVGLPKELVENITDVLKGSLVHRAKHEDV